MLPPMMPLVHDLIWLGGLATLTVFALRSARRFELRSPLPNLLWPDLLRREPAASSPWFTTTRSSGNTAFDDWRDGEIAQIEAQREALEGRLAAFEAFVDKLKRTKDRATFERFMAEHPEVATTGYVAADAGDQADHCPG